MASYVETANLAASKLGEDDQLVNPDDDTHLGRSVKAIWASERRAALRDHSWNFAMRRAGLTPADLDTIAYPWDYSFPLPADSVRLIEVLNRGTRDDYQIEGKSILTHDIGPVYIRYIADVPEPALWDDLFVEAFACRIAMAINNRITGGAVSANELMQQYAMALKEAKRVDARENPQIPYEPTSWEMARTGFGDGSDNISVSYSAGLYQTGFHT